MTQQIRTSFCMHKDTVLSGCVNGTHLERSFQSFEPVYSNGEPLPLGHQTTLEASSHEVGPVYGYGTD